MSADTTRCVRHLEEAIDAARALGLEIAEAVALREVARTRLGFSGDVYVLALVGGTGVGKSTLLNALASAEVSPVGPRRPTTNEPRAWIPAARRAQLVPLLEWVGVDALHEHAGERLQDVAIVDLPDIDSLARDHRARVDALLPRVDAVAWVVDPEKYKDEVIHGAYLRTLARRIERQIVVLNRTDLLAADDVARVRDDLAAELREAGLAAVPIALTRAVDGTSGIEELRRWVESEVDAKRVVALRVATSVRSVVQDLARQAGIADAATPIASDAKRAAVLADVLRSVLAVVDVAGASAQAAAATRLAARGRGAGPMGLLTSWIYRASGRAGAAADPVSYLRRWRRRGSLAPAVEPARELVSQSLPSLPAPLRSSVAALAEPSALERRLSEAVDRAVAARTGSVVVPRSAVWSLIGAGQWAVTALLIFAALWFAALFVIDAAPVGVVDLPALGPVPRPLLLLAAVLLAGYVLAVMLRLHAGWLGREWGRRVARDVRTEVEERVRESVFVPLDALEAWRTRLAEAVRWTARDCPP